MKSLSIALTGAAVLLGSPTLAAEIAPVSVEASSTFFTYNVNALIDGSGLNADGLHDGTFSNMWMTDLGEPQGQLEFDLGGVYTIDAADIWQYNFGTNTPVISTLDRGVNSFRILTSLDGDDFDEVFSGNMTRAPGDTLVAAQTFAMGGVTARFVRFDLLTNFAGGTIYEDEYPVGLSEVRFQGMAAVPEPATWALLILGFGLTGAAMRRRDRVLAVAR